MIKGKIKTFNELSEWDIKQMFQLFSVYYDNVSFENFRNDLSEKTHIIIGYKDSRVIGFSTLKEKFIALSSGKMVKGLFSGDTIVERAYWGKTPLRRMFVQYIWLYKLRNPFSKVYWFLISKGYKTYVVLAHNFKVFYPRYDKKTPALIKEIIDEYGKGLSPDHYEPSSGRILGSQKKDRLKKEVAPIFNNLSQLNPHISFFEKVNPNWVQGDELVCLGEIQLLQPFSFFTKILTRKLFRNKSKSVGSIEKVEVT